MRLIAVFCSLLLASGGSAPAQSREFALSEHGVPIGTETVRTTGGPEATRLEVQHDSRFFLCMPWTWERTEFPQTSRLTATYRGLTPVALDEQGRVGSRERQSRLARGGADEALLFNGTAIAARMPAGAMVVPQGYLGLLAWAVTQHPSAVALLSLDNGSIESGTVVDDGLARVQVDGSERSGRRCEVRFPAWWVDVWTVDGEPVLVRDSRHGLEARAGRFAHVRIVETPKGVIEDEIRFAAADGTMLAGVLARPDRTSPRGCALLLQGSGPDDASGRFLGLPFLDRVAAALAEAGWASLRWADRGTGGSAGDFSTIRLADLRADARGALRWMREKHEHLPVALIGHSEGALTAALLAAESPAPDAVFLLGCPSLPVDRVLLEQMQRESGPESLALQELLEAVRATSGPTLTRNGTTQHVGWLRDHMGLDPIAAVGAAPCRLELFQGLADEQVRPAHVDRLEAGLRVARDAGFLVHRFAGLDHMFMAAVEADPGRPGREIAPEFVRALVARVVAVR